MSKENLPVGELTDETSPTFSLLNQLFKQTVTHYSNDLDKQIAASKALRERYATPPAQSKTIDNASYLPQESKK